MCLYEYLKNPFTFYFLNHDSKYFLQVDKSLKNKRKMQTETTAENIHLVQFSEILLKIIIFIFKVKHTDFILKLFQFSSR